MNLFSRSNLSLMNKIILAFVVYVTMILLVFSVIVIMIDRGHVRSISDSYSENIVDDRSAIVNQWIDERIKDVEVLALSESVQSMDIEKAMTYLKEASNNNGDTYFRYYIVTEAGEMTDTLGIRKTMNGSYDFTNAEEGSNGVIITAPIQDETFKQATIEVLVPVMDDGEVKGVLGATVLLENLSKKVSKRYVSSTGYAWVVNAQGKIVSHIDDDQIGNFLPMAEDNPTAYDTLLATVKSEERGQTTFENTEDETEYVVYNKLDGQTDWYMMVSLYQSDIYRTVNQLIGSLTLIFVIAVVLSGAASWFLAKDITRPIESLIEVTNKFTTGIKGIRANIESKDEIGTLAKSFNNMADTIVAHTDNLEELIKERTSVLADLNYQIVSRNKELGTMNEELEKTNNTLHELASTDMLTGLYNRHEFQRELQKTIELVNDGREENFALLFIDLDNFKYYNDAFSHEIGDFLLQQVAGILESKVRGNDIVGRYGGDEFVILLREGDYEIAKTIAQRIHKAILDTDGFKEALKERLNADVKIMGKNKLSSSIGIVKYMKSMNMSDAEDLLAKADETMYKAKKQGKSRVVVG